MIVGIHSNNKTKSIKSYRLYFYDGYTLDDDDVIILILYTLYEFYSKSIQ